MSLYTNAFDNRVVLTAAAKPSSDKKKTDIAGVYLSIVPAIRSSVSELQGVIDEIEDPAVKQELTEWNTQIVGILEKILTKVIEVSRASLAPKPQPGQPVAGQITPQMISGEPPITKG